MSPRKFQLMNSVNFDCTFCKSLFWMTGGLILIAANPLQIENSVATKVYVERRQVCFSRCNCDFCLLVVVTRAATTTERITESGITNTVMTRHIWRCLILAFYAFNKSSWTFFAKFASEASKKWKVQTLKNVWKIRKLHYFGAKIQNVPKATFENIFNFRAENVISCPFDEKIRIFFFKNRIFKKSGNLNFRAQK